ncbi:helix-turn-helix domain-containing protein [Actinacidiphila oryziradicis]|uniref:Helix-turn-helix domain-containing protein n=1 Tax=Actinacidiphila oryziradicis TaxID=2571141 RepID=A0A4U0SH14_9ACTN|nr:helix-turn-helix transcriptional regulator [Actinacidiphila oryziradicis]TJZ99534.1 helix-turn-helix domain-containing protein [Actinacidiphila oryziradicis]
MAARGNQTARQLRLGIELRRLRERAGLSSTEAGRLLGTNQTQISNIEASRFGVSADRVRALTRNYSCADDALVDALVTMAEDRKRGWWEEYREILPAGLLDLAEIEHHATEVRVVHLINIPGLLQTTDHARAIFDGIVPTPAAYEVEHRVSHRMKRQAVLHGEHPTPYKAIIHEAALRMQFGGPDTARKQLEHLVGMSERENVSIVVIPFGDRSFPCTGDGVVYLYGPVPQLDTVQLDTPHGSEFFDAPTQLEKYRLTLDRMERVALPPKDSRDLIHRITQNL